MTRLICRVTDSKGLQDIIEVNSLDEVPTKWVKCKVMREEKI